MEGTISDNVQRRFWSTRRSSRFATAFLDAPYFVLRCITDQVIVEDNFYSKLNKSEDVGGNWKLVFVDMCKSDLWIYGFFFGLTNRTNGTLIYKVEFRHIKHGICPVSNVHPSHHFNPCASIVFTHTRRLRLSVCLSVPRQNSMIEWSDPKV
jgi:hypothetical protein